MKILLSFAISALAMNGLTSKAQSSFYFTSSSSSWVGHGETELITTQNGSISLLSGYEYDSGLHLAITTTSGESWNLDFGTSTGGNLSDGMYANATRWPFNNGSPGLSFSGQARGDNTLTGWFDVLDVMYSGSTVTSAAVDFVQYDEGNKAAENYGSIRYNSAIPVDFSPVPEPQTLAFAAMGALSALFMKKNRSKQLK